MEKIQPYSKEIKNTEENKKEIENVRYDEYMRLHNEYIDNKDKYHYEVVKEFCKYRCVLYLYIKKHNIQSASFPDMRRATSTELLIEKKLEKHKSHKKILQTAWCRLDYQDLKDLNKEIDILSDRLYSVVYVLSKEYDELSYEISAEQWGSCGRNYNKLLSMLDIENK
jgi:hypothetical protein